MIFYGYWFDCETKDEVITRYFNYFDRGLTSALADLFAIMGKVLCEEIGGGFVF